MLSRPNLQTRGSSPVRPSASFDYSYDALVSPGGPSPILSSFASPTEEPFVDIAKVDGGRTKRNCFLAFGAIFAAIICFMFGGAIASAITLSMSNDDCTEPGPPVTIVSDGTNDNAAMSTNSLVLVATSGGCNIGCAPSAPWCPAAAVCKCELCLDDDAKNLTATTGLRLWRTNVYGHPEQAEQLKAVLPCTLVAEDGEPLRKECPKVSTEGIFRSKKNSDDDRIVGGSSASISSIPHQVRVQLGGYTCGGSVVSSTWILTAGHCCSGMNVDNCNINVQFGQTTMMGYPGGGGSCTSTASSSTHRCAVEMHIHPSYSGQTLNADACLLRLAQPLPSGATWQAIPMATSVPPVGTAVQISGWGTTSSGGQASMTLLTATVNTVAHSTLQQQYGAGVTTGMIGAMASGRDACQGDSGGPMTVMEGGVRKQLGIVSYGQGCADPNYAGVYYRPAEIASWMSNTMAQPSTCSSPAPSPPSSPPPTAPVAPPPVSPPPPTASGTTNIDLTITISGGYYPAEKWAVISSKSGGTGTMYWKQGSTCGAGAGHLTNTPFSVPCGTTVYITTWDAWGDGWDGAKYAIRRASDNALIANNGGASPTNGVDNDLASGWDDTTSAVCVASELETTESFSVPCPAPQAAPPVAVPVAPPVTPGTEQVTITISGGTYYNEKWMAITSASNGGTVHWSQGATCGVNAGLITTTVPLPCGEKIYINTYDAWGDGWDGTKYTLKLADGAIVANNNGASPNNGVDNDAMSSFDSTATELCSVKELESSESVTIPCSGTSSPPPAPPAPTCSSTLNVPYGSCVESPVGGEFAVGSTCTSSCSGGRTVVGSSSLTCGSDGTWSGSFTCAASCPALSVANSGGCAGGPHGTQCTKSCSSGYTATSSGSLTCNNGQWSGTWTCAAPCPAISGANSNGCPSAAHGGTCAYSCNAGYAASSTSPLTCNNGQWSGTVQCAATTCPAPTISGGGSCTQAGPWRTGDVCQLQCPPGWSPSGASSATCDGTKFNTALTCVQTGCAIGSMCGSSFGPWLASGSACVMGGSPSACVSGVTQYELACNMASLSISMQGANC